MNVVLGLSGQIVEVELYLVSLMAMGTDMTVGRHGLCWISSCRLRLTMSKSQCVVSGVTVQFFFSDLTCSSLRES